MIRKISVYILIFIVLAVVVSCKNGRPLELKETPASDPALNTADSDLPRQDVDASEGENGEEPGDSGGKADNPGEGQGSEGTDPPVPPGQDPPSGGEVSEPVYTNSIGMEFISVSTNTFFGGSCRSSSQCLPGTTVDTKAREHESPQYHARINTFKMGVYEVTLGQFKKFLEAESRNDLLPASFNNNNNHGDEAAVVDVSWNAVHEFIKWLNRKENLSGDEQYRLPSEAEWEYASRAGTKTHFPWGDDENKAELYGWYDENTDDINERYVHPVGQKLPNDWGLYDMHGNVWEMVSDWYEDDYYGSINGIGNNPRGHSKREIVERYNQEGRTDYCASVHVATSSNPCHISRGGSYHYSVNFMRPAYRNSYSGDGVSYNDDLGFRLVKGN
jgi:formylglycine-generating enzyme required for sulfatase activity